MIIIIIIIIIIVQYGVYEDFSQSLSYYFGSFQDQNPKYSKPKSDGLTTDIGPPR